MFVPRSRPRHTAGEWITVPLADKPSVHVILGQASGLRYGTQIPWRCASARRSWDGDLPGRLMSTVRDKEGLTYNIGAQHGRRQHRGRRLGNLRELCARLCLTRAWQSTRRELEKWWKDGVTDQELAARKQGLIGGYFVGLSTTGGLAETILDQYAARATI